MSEVNNNGNGKDNSELVAELDKQIKDMLTEAKGTPGEKHAELFAALTIIGITAQTVHERYGLPGHVVTSALHMIAEKAEASMKAAGRWDGPDKHSLAGYL